MFDIWLSGRMEFSDDDRRECLDTVITIVEMAYKARKESLLALESDIQHLDDVFFQKGLTMCVDAMHPDYIGNILQNFIISGNYRGGALLKRLLIMEGVISICNSENPQFLYGYTLASLFGEDFMPEYEEYCDPKINAIVNPQIYVDKFLDAIKDKEFPPNPLEDILSKANDFDIITTLREIDGNDLKIAILGLSEPVVRKVFANMSRRNVEQIVYDLIKNVRHRDITAGQNRILAKIKELEEAGRIVILK